MRGLFLILITSLLTGCGLQWVNRINPSANYDQDQHECKVEALRLIPNTVVTQTPAPTNYMTSCDRIGTSISCDSRAMGRADTSTLQNIQDMHSSSARSSHVSSCMKAKGWGLEKQANTGQADIGSQIAQFNSEMKSIVDGFESNTCGDERLRVIFSKTKCNVRDLTLTQMTDETFITEGEKSVLVIYEQKLRILSTQQLNVISKYVQPSSLRDGMISLRAQQFNEVLNNCLDLYQGKIRWGEYNKKRVDLNTIHLRQMSDLQIKSR
jgi:hypothetical protein